MIRCIIYSTVLSLVLDDNGIYTSDGTVNSGHGEKGHDPELKTCTLKSTEEHSDCKLHTTKTKILILSN